MFTRVDRCRARSRLRMRLVGLDERTAYGDRRLYAGLHARWGRLRLRLYVLGPARCKVA